MEIGLMTTDPWLALGAVLSVGALFSYIVISTMREVGRRKPITPQARAKAEAESLLPEHWTARSRHRGFDSLAAVTAALAIGFFHGAAYWKPAFAIGVVSIALSVYFGRRSISGPLKAATDGMREIERTADTATVIKYYEALAAVYNERAVRQIREHAQAP